MRILIVTLKVIVHIASLITRTRVIRIILDLAEVECQIQHFKHIPPPLDNKMTTS